jgi:uncharacterized repeat protein (TIGR04044 family)
LADWRLFCRRDAIAAIFIQAVPLLFDCNIERKLNGFDEWICNPTIGTSFAISGPLTDPQRERLNRFSPLSCKEDNMPAVTAPAHQKGDFLVDYEEKVFEDVKAAPGEKALITFHTVAFEGSIGLVNMLQALRLQRKGFATSVLLYGPGVTLGVQRGFPKLGDEAFPGHLNFNNQLMKFMTEGGKIYACRFALQALYGHGEPSLIPGIRPISPLDVLDLILLHRKDGAFILNTWTL